MTYTQQLFYREFDAMITTIPFESEVQAIASFLPNDKNKGIEIGLGTGNFSAALGIKKGIEPAMALRNIAYKKGIEVIDAIAEKLPYTDDQFDFVLMASCISYFIDVNRAFREANRVLKMNGNIIVGFIDKNSVIGKAYEARRKDSVFYKQASFYTPERVMRELKAAGFENFEFAQTLFKPLDEIHAIETFRPGYGEGSFVVIKATKLFSK